MRFRRDQEFRCVCRFWDRGRGPTPAVVQGREPQLIRTSPLERRSASKTLGGAAEDRWWGTGQTR